MAAPKEETDEQIARGAANKAVREFYSTHDRAPVSLGQITYDIILSAIRESKRTPKASEETGNLGERCAEKIHSHLFKDRGVVPPLVEMFPADEIIRDIASIVNQEAERTPMGQTDDTKRECN